MQRLERDEERFVLLAMNQTLVERGLCLREHTDNGPLLIFPSFYRRERPELVGHPAVLVSYRFTRDPGGPAPSRRAVSTGQTVALRSRFQNLDGEATGFKLTRGSEGTGELVVYFDPAIPVEERIIFSRYIHEHLLQKGQEIVRLRHYVCPHCRTTVGNREVAMKRLDRWLEGKVTATADLPTILCVACEKRVPLWDDLEQRFASPETQQRVRELQEQSALVLDNESKERGLVGDVISTVANAGQISREFNVSDHGVDMEVEVKDDNGEATGFKLYLQLKSGDSDPRDKERHAHYWMARAVTVLRMMRNSEGEVRWMEVRDWLKRDTEFQGERFDVMSVRRWRDKMLKAK